jgi:hypothetical protein
MPTTTWSSTQASTPSWTPEFQTLNDRLLAGITGRLANPAAGTDPLRISAINATNRRFQGIPQKLATNLASRGYGKSGSLGSGIKGVEFARQGALSDIEGKFAEMLLGREDKNYDLATALMGMNRGQTQTGSGTQKTTKSWLENIMSLAGLAMPFITGGLMGGGGGAESYFGGMGGGYNPSTGEF